MRCVVRFMHPKLFRTRREWSYSARQAVNTNGTSTLATSPPSGGAAASFARNSSIELSKRISATVPVATGCRASVVRRRTLGVSQKRPTNLVKIVRLAPEKLLVAERLDIARFD